VRRARGWLEEGKKVKVRMRFRGREITYPEIGRERLRNIAEELSDVSEVEQRPSLDRYSMLMVLTPKTE
jgi:translation initiation factor IF-3